MVFSVTLHAYRRPLIFQKNHPSKNTPSNDPSLRFEGGNPECEQSVILAV